MAMNCDTFRQNIDAYLDGELSRPQRDEMDAHADACEACRSALDQAISLSAMCAELNEGLTVPLEAQAAWRKAVRAESGKKRGKANLWLRGMGTAAAALVLLVTGTFGMRAGMPASVSQSVTLGGGYYSFKDEGRRPDDDGMPTGRVMTVSNLQSDGALDEDRGATDETMTAATGDIMETAAVEPVILRSAERSIHSANYDADFMWLQDLVAEYDAWFEERTVTAPAQNDQTTGRVAGAVVRVPSERLDDFLTELDQLGRTVMRSESAEDVTGRYTDTASRLDALQMQKDKLNEMLAGCENVDELIAIDDKLTEVIASMESLEGDLRRWDSLRSYSRVTLTLTETVEAPAAAEVPLPARMKAGFEESVQWLGEFGQDALVLLASAAPRLVVWVPAAALVVILLWAIFGRRRK